MNSTQKRVINSNLIVHHLKTGISGPTIVITANIHGDECTGIGVVISLLESLPKCLRRGEVFLYPSLNPNGLKRMMRVYPDDGKDLNRLFPGSILGTQSQKHIHAIWTSIKKCKPNLVLDLHTDSVSSIPYVILDRQITKSKNPDVLREMEELARASALTLVWEYREMDYRRYRLEKSLSGAVLNLLGVPSLTLEVGPRRTMDPSAIRIATDAVLAIFSKKEMLNTPILSNHIAVAGRWYRGNGPISHQAGVLVPSLSAGTVVQRGDEIGRVYSSTGAELEVICSHFPGLVLSLPDQCWVRQNQSCATLAMASRPEL
jgi:predicted deacylase